MQESRHGPGSEAQGFYTLAYARKKQFLQTGAEKITLVSMWKYLVNVIFDYVRICWCRDCPFAPGISPWAASPRLYWL